MEFIVFHARSSRRDGAKGDRCDSWLLDGRTDCAEALSRMLLSTLLMLSFLIPISVSAAADSVQYTTPDGFRVHAHYYRPEAPATRAVLILPDENEGKEAWGAIADTLSRRGFHVLVADLRGTGESVVQRGLRRDRGSFTVRERAAGAMDGQAGMRYLRNLHSGPVQELIVIGSGTGSAGVLGCLTDGFERAVAHLVSPRGVAVANEQPDPGRLGAGRLLIVVARDDLLGIEASARLVDGFANRVCWIAEGRAMGAEFLGNRMDLFDACMDWMTTGLVAATADQ